MRPLKFAVLLAAMSLSTGAMAQSPCSAEDSSYRDFDFWLGEWEVVAEANGTKAGENSITRAEGDCVLIERWTSAQGTTGQSYNYYDPHSKEWTQIWVSAAAIINISGGLQEGAMHLAGDIVYQKTGVRNDFRGSWTLLEDGTVRQHFEQFDAESDSWKPWFTGIYSRKS